MSRHPAPVALIGVSMKMYHGHRATLAWLREVRSMAESNRALRSRAVSLFVLPTYPALVPAGRILDGTGVRYGAQDASWAEFGAFTGEVSAAELREIGCRYVELGHAERRTQLGETDDMIARKVDAVLRHRMAPVVCVGEQNLMDPAEAAEFNRSQLDASLARVRGGDRPGGVVVAYEPQWAIGAAEPADPEYVRTVVRALRGSLAEHSFAENARVIYGGSAGPGLLTALGPEVDGLFLGRSAQNVAALESIIDEAASRSGTPTGSMGGSPNSAR